MHRAIGNQLTCVFVDNGLLRLYEAEQVMQTFADNLGVKVIHVDATEQFMTEAGRRCRPREEAQDHRPRIRRMCSRRNPPSWKTPSGWRKAPFTRTSSSRPAPRPRRRTPSRATTTSAVCPTTLHLKLLEPLRELFKDEVRELGIALGLPHDMVYRHPFPGPGLGVRILGEVRRDFADLLRQADAIFIEELRASGWYEKTSQAFAVFLPVKSVGVMGDGRTYDYVVALRAVQTQDFMTAHWAELPYTLLGKVSNRIINEIRGINRVVYDISGKPPATIEWE
jgi:GMP synthase (glutamine-hydrolysing)